MISSVAAKRLRGLGCACVVWAGLGIAPARGQASPVTVIQSRADGAATFVVAADGEAIPVSPLAGRPVAQPMDFMRQHGALFGVTDPDRQLALNLRRTRTDAIGHMHTAYSQVHKGVPVFTGLLMTHQDAQGRFVAANGDFYPVPAKLSTTPAVTANEAIGIAEGEIESGEPAAVVDVELAELVIVDPGWYGDPPRGARLAYYVILSDEAVGLREGFFVDAHSREVLDRWNMLHSARQRAVFDGRGLSSLPGTIARAEGDPPFVNDIAQLEQDVNRAYDYAGDFYDYMYRAFGRDSIDAVGMEIIQTVRSGALNCPNAAWLGDQAVYCLGAATDDIVAHELMHGVTDFTANLIYQNQSGQLNESYSDVFGELVDLFNGDVSAVGIPGGAAWPKDADYIDDDLDLPNTRRQPSVCINDTEYPQKGVRWLVGEDATSFGGHIRDMFNPPCEGDPDRAYSNLQICGGSNNLDNGGVHSGSGIPNHGFAILVDGKFFGQQLASIGAIKAGAVWFRALITYLTPASDFADAFVALNQAAADLVGTYPNDPRTGSPSTDQFTEEDAERVYQALVAVEMNSDGRCGASVPIFSQIPPNYCPDKSTIFFDDVEGITAGWQVDNSFPQTAYDWEVRGQLPAGRSGNAWFVADPSIGSCTFQDDESGRHRLFTPVITLPDPVIEPGFSFTHFVATEAAWDGGNVKISVNGGNWQTIAPSDYVLNPYNMNLASALSGNTNPLASQPAFSGADARWGISVVNLGRFVSGGETVRLMFDFGKDGCAGVTGWFVDDVEVFHCGCATAAECSDGDACTLDYCESGSCAQTFIFPCALNAVGTPEANSIDARQPYPINEPSAIEGRTTIDFLAFFVPTLTLSPDLVVVTEHGGDGFAPDVLSVEEIEPAIFRLTLSEPLEPGTWTRISLQGSDAAMCFGVLPGDVDGSGGTGVQDITALIDSMNGLAGYVRPEYATDLNRSGATNVQDITTLIDLLNGAGAFDPWNGRSIGPSPCD